MTENVASDRTGSIEQRLASWLSDHVGGHDVVISDFRRHTEGFSWHTYTLTASWRSEFGEPVSHGYAIRREPEDGLLAPYDIRAQFDLQRALFGMRGIPIPEVYWLEMDRSILGMPFFVMDRIQGHVPVQWAPNDPVAFPDEATRFDLGHQFVDVLGAIHQADIGALPVSVNVTPATVCEQATEHWYRIYREAAFQPIAVVEIAADWLRENPHPSGRITFCHGDYRIGNFIVIDAKIAAVLDWELAEVSDPVGDLAWAGLPLFRGRSPLWSHLLPQQAFLSRYAAVTGHQVASETLQYWTIMCYLKSISSYVRATRAFREGRTTDLRMAAMDHQAIYVLQQLRAELQKVGALS